MSAVKRVLIVGGGISGLTLAAALGRQGIQAELVEIKPQLSDQGGVGLSIIGNATKALAEIGVAEKCIQAGMPADHLAMRTPDGSLIKEHTMPRLGGSDWPGTVGITRKVFHEILIEAARAAGASLTCGVTVKSIAQHAEKVSVEFTDGRSGDYDLLVAADGLYSSIRKMIFPDAPSPKYCGQSVWRAYAPRPADITASQLHFGGRHGVVGICPVSQTESYVYIVQAAPEGFRRDPATLDVQIQEELQGYGGAIPSLAAQMTDPELINFRPLEWFLMPDPWFNGRVVIIGDAAHSNPPVLAQGAAMGIEDAIVLSEEIKGTGSIADALKRFMKRRFDRVRIVVERSCELSQAEVEHREDFDASVIMNEANQTLAQPY